LDVGAVAVAFGRGLLATFRRNGMFLSVFGWRRLGAFGLGRMGLMMGFIMGPMFVVVPGCVVPGSIVLMSIMPMIVVRLPARHRRRLGFDSRRVVGVSLVLMSDFGCRLLRRLARRLIARIRVTGGRLARSVLAQGILAGRHLGPKLRGGDGSARNGFVAASMRTLAMAVAAAIATVAAAMVIVGFVIVARGARVGLNQRLPVGDRIW
jgi:hypothetical protein